MGYHPAPAGIRRGLGGLKEMREIQITAAPVTSTSACPLRDRAPTPSASPRLPARGQRPPVPRREGLDWPARGPSERAETHFKLGQAVGGASRSVCGQGQAMLCRRWRGGSAVGRPMPAGRRLGGGEEEKRIDWSTPSHCKTVRVCREIHGRGRVRRMVDTPWSRSRMFFGIFFCATSFT